MVKLMLEWKKKNKKNKNIQIIIKLNWTIMDNHLLNLLPCKTTIRNIINHINSLYLSNLMHLKNLRNMAYNNTSTTIINNPFNNSKFRAKINFKWVILTINTNILHNNIINSNIIKIQIIQVINEILYK